MPAIQDVLTYNDQRYVCVEIVERLNASGKPAPYSIWEARCAHPGCTAALRQSFPPDFPRKGVALNRRCPQHRRPGVPVDGSRTRGRSPAGFLAAEWMLRLRAAAGGPLTTVEFVKVVEAHYDDMEPEVAAKLGARSTTDSARRQLVLRALKIAETTKRLCSRRESYDLTWDFTDVSRPR